MAFSRTGSRPHLTRPTGLAGEVGQLRRDIYDALAAIPAPVGFVKADGSVPFQGSAFNAFAEFYPGSAALPAIGNAGRLRFNAITQTFEFSANAIHYSPIVPADFVYEPGGTQSNGVFVVFEDLIAAIAARPLSAGAAKIVFSDRFASPIVVPAGTYNTLGRPMTWHGAHLGVETFVRLDDGVVFSSTPDGLMPVRAFVDDITVESYADSAGSNLRPFEVAVTLSDHQIILADRGGTLPRGMVDLAPIRVTDTGAGYGLSVVLLFAGRITAGAWESIENVSAGLTGFVMLLDGLAEVGPSVIRGAAPVQFYIANTAVTLDTNQPNAGGVVTLSFVSGALVPFAPSVPADWPTPNPTNHDEALNQLGRELTHGPTTPGAYPYTPVYGDQVVLVVGAGDITLPAAGANPPMRIVIKDSDGSASAISPIVITPNGAETIDGAATKSIIVAFGAVELQSRAGVGWYITGGYLS